MLIRLTAAVLLSVSALGGHHADAAVDTTVPVGDSVPADDSTPPTTELDNPFLPEDANIGDCISAVPRPECGSKARGGWRQGLVFAAVAGAIVVIGARLVIGVKKRRPAG